MADIDVKALIADGELFIRNGADVDGISKASLAADPEFTGAFAPVGAVAGAGGAGGNASHLWIGTETEYGAIGSPSATTVYVVMED